MVDAVLRLRCKPHTPPCAAHNPPDFVQELGYTGAARRPLGGRRGAMLIDYALGLVVALGLAGYLVLALADPDRF